MKRTATARWNGDLKEGKGSISTQSNTLAETPYSFNARFAEGTGTNPEELLGAAHAGCFTMALSAALTQQGFTAGSLETKAIVTLDPVALQISGISLELNASLIEGLTEEQFQGVAQAAKENCPLSKALSAVPTTLTVRYQ